MLEFVENFPSFVFNATKWLFFVCVAVGAAYHFLLHYHANLPLPEKLHAWFRKREHNPHYAALVQEALNQMGLSRQKQRLIQIALSSGSYELTNSRQECLLRLIPLLAEYTERAEVAITYGRATPQQSSFYINSMAAAQNVEHRKMMARLLEWLMVRQPPENPLDFLLASKAGNPLLADQVAQDRGYLCVLRKHDDEASRSKSTALMGATSRALNIEGLPQLQRRCTQVEAIYGVSVDCNCSGGSTHVRGMVEFNEIVELLALSSVPVNRLYVLYRADDSALATFPEGTCKLEVFRFFDLDEEIKGALFDLRYKNGGPFHPNNVNYVRDIIKTLEKKNLMRIEG